MISTAGVGVLGVLDCLDLHTQEVTFSKCRDYIW